MGIVVVPLFPDVELQQWISWMENYFDRKGLTDFEKLHMAHGFIWGEAERYINSINSIMPIRNWKEMKETLLLRFGADDDPEKIKLQIESDRCLENVMNWKPQKISATIQKKLRENDKKLKIELHSALGSLDTVSNRDVVYETEVEQVTKSPLLGESEEKLVAEMSLNVPDMVKKMALATVDGASVSSSHWPVSSSEAAQEAEVELKLASLQEMEHQAGVKRDISADSCVEQTDSSLETVSNFSLVVEKLTDRMNSSKESVPETCLVSNDCLVPNCLLPAIMFQRASHSETEQETGVVVMEDTMIPLEQNMDSLQEHQLVQQIYSPSPVLEESDSVKFLGGTVIINAENVKVACVHRLCDHKFQRVPSKIRQWKCVKTWKFKFKRRSISKMVKRHWVQLKGNPSFKELRDVDVAHVYLVQVQRLSDVTLLTSEQQILEPRRKCYKSWHFTYKPGKAGREEQHTTSQYLVSEQQYCEPKKYCKSWHFKYKPDEVKRKKQDKHVLCSAHVVNHGDDLLRMAEKGRSLRFWQSLLQCLCVWLEEWISLCKIPCMSEDKTVTERSQGLTQVIIQISVLKALAEFRVANCSVRFDNSSLTPPTLQQSRLLRMIIRRMHKLRLSESSQAVRQFPVGDGKFQVKHRWRFKQLPHASVSASVLEQNAGRRSELQPCGILHSHSFIVLLSSSLRSSFFSSEGVYMRALVDLLLVKMLIWWFTIASKSDLLNKRVSKQWEETELSRHWMVQVENHKSFKERSSLVIPVKRHILLVPLHQKQQWEKIYKSRMFKYKSLLQRQNTEVNEYKVAVVEVSVTSCELAEEGIGSHVLSMKFTHQFSEYKLEGKLSFNGDVLIDT
ncbi:hypothetical protein Bca4012_025150 [Brassica carinata]